MASPPAAGAADIYAIERPDRKLLTLYLLRALLALPAFPIVILPLLFKYETLRYRFDDEGVTMAYGLLWRHETFLTYARIQDIHLSAGLLERWLGLATINIQTAAGSSSSEMSIVGLTQFERVRDFLYLKMRGARFGDAAADVAAHEPHAPVAAAAAGDDELIRLLTEIRDGLRRRQEAPR